MKIVTLLENTACREDVATGHGLSQYIETDTHKILLDMGPGEDFAANAEKMGVDLSAVDVAVLSHGHNDHSGGLRAFFSINHRARVYVHPAAFGSYWAVEADGTGKFLGLEDGLREEFADRFVEVSGVTVIDDTLTLFDTVDSAFPAVDTSARLKEKTAEGYTPDRFLHEHNLIVREGDKAVVFGGCAHRGIVNIRDAAAAILGREPDALVSGFHLFNLTEGNEQGDALIRATAEELNRGSAVCYTGHCTGDHAYGLMKEILGQKLEKISTGGVQEL